MIIIIIIKALFNNVELPILYTFRKLMKNTYAHDSYCDLDVKGLIIHDSYFSERTQKEHKIIVPLPWCGGGSWQHRARFHRNSFKAIAPLWPLGIQYIKWHHSFLARLSAPSIVHHSHLHHQHWHYDQYSANMEAICLAKEGVNRPSLVLNLDSSVLLWTSLVNFFFFDAVQVLLQYTLILYILLSLI